MILREVFGWLRYCLQQDPVCIANQIVVEEIPSAFLSQMDVNDGPRTLAIYQVEKGYTPRIEIRFTAERPQVWWMGEEEGNGKYLLSPYSSRFPGDFRSWTRTQFVHYLIDVAKSKLCNDTVTFVTLIPDVQAAVKVEAMDPPKMDLDGLMRVVNAAHSSLKKGTKVTKQSVINFLHDNYSISATNSFNQLAHDAIYWLSKGKLQVKDLEALEAAVKKGSGGEIDLWNPFCQLLQDPALQDKLNSDWLDRIQECAPKSLQASHLEDLIRQIVEARNAGEELQMDLSAGEFGEHIEAALKRDEIPLPYLDILSKADYKEALSPWSTIRRSVIAFEIPKDNSNPIEDTVVDWLEGAHLTQALYRSDDEMVKDIVKRKVHAFAQKTIGNPNWVKTVYDDIVGKVDEMSLAKTLQSEFDVWLLQALSPSVAASKLPLSPHAYNLGKKDEELYSRVFGSWLHTLKASAAERREQSIKNLSHGLENFYKQVVSDWNKESLEDYTPRVPAVKLIMSAVMGGDEDKLFHVLVADVESEAGVKVPEEVKATLMAGPFFCSVYREIRFQSVKL